MTHSIEFQACDEVIYTLKISGKTTLKLHDEVVGLIEAGKGKFRCAPVILEIKDTHFQANELAVLVEILAQNQVVVIGVRSSIQELLDFAKFTGLAVFDGPSVASKIEPTKVQKVIQNIAEKNTMPKIIVGDVTSSEQVLAKDGDLALMGTVEEGADVIAQGSITTYKAMKGNAFAGVDGDTEATIVIQSFDAQLVSIAGVYKQFNTVPNKLQSQPVRVSLKNGKLKFKTL
ncbi:MAG: septum site-determining protein MinC [Gammaproteobacteria bacterium]|uniref:Probable septum site-determining protein MinC n=1 Tax=endosymbiont of Bathymodiolus septemdierum str. Myojin knoll TaxID=1303921 RepID=A0A0P0USF2_9GAMM|nr:septum site-determining protein MinC [Bathymodiolus septemdierum thioautotrophic gill symbiont]RUA06257.1 MAG: septum site-determining protein MinC [Gammaproteobacteria bacterium]BAS68061.1 septum site-determining protein MinC [endosymbiont of Bathymodiolus septemdierum str. Myojin knoll]